MIRANEIKSGTKLEPVVISRTFPAPRDLVFRAWSSAEHLKRWFCPEGCSVPEAQVDFRPGGLFAMCMRLPTGEDHRLSGVYTEISPPDRLVFRAWERVSCLPSFFRSVSARVAGSRNTPPWKETAAPPDER